MEEVMGDMLMEVVGVTEDTLKVEAEVEVVEAE